MKIIKIGVTRCNFFATCNIRKTFPRFNVLYENAELGPVRQNERNVAPSSFLPETHAARQAPIEHSKNKIITYFKIEVHPGVLWTYVQIIWYLMCFLLYPDKLITTGYFSKPIFNKTEFCAFQIYFKPYYTFSEIREKLRHMQ